MIGNIFMIVLGSVFLVLGVINQKKRSAQLNSGDFKEITGTCVDFSEDWSTDSDGMSSVSYYAIYEYEVDGMKYSYTSKLGLPSKKGLGKTANLLYNTKNPSECISPKDKTSILTIVIGILLTVGGIVLFFVK